MRAHSHTDFFFFFFFSCQRWREGAAYQRCWFDGGNVFTDLAVERPALVRSRPQLWPGVPVHSLIPHASMVLQGGGKRGDSGAGCFPGPPHWPFLVELLLLPNLPECSTHPALNASFSCLFSRYCLQVLPMREKGIAKQLQAPPSRQLLDLVVFFWRPLFPKRRNQMAPVGMGELCNAYHW